MVVVPLACRSCLHYVRLEIGASTEVSSPTTWYCPLCGTPTTADLGAPLLRIRSAAEPSAPAEQTLNPKAAALVEESRQRVAEHQRQKATRASELSRDELEAADEARRQRQREAIAALISVDLSDVADRPK